MACLDAPGAIDLPGAGHELESSDVPGGPALAGRFFGPDAAAEFARTCAFLKAICSNRGLRLRSEAVMRCLQHIGSKMRTDQVGEAKRSPPRSRLWCRRRSYNGTRALATDREPRADVQRRAGAPPALCSLRGASANHRRIESGDPVRSREAMIDHLDHVRNGYIELLRAISDG